VYTTVRLGRFAGVDIGLHWSALGMAVLLVAGLSTGPLRALFPGYPAHLYVATALIITALFLLSLLAHELAHAVVAVREGVTVDGITLWLLGGVARLRDETRTPGADARVAGVGPLTSLVLGAVFASITALLWWVDVDPIVTGSAGYLALINVVLGVFNLIPAAPLDGGRLLRAALWAAGGDRGRAQVWSARAGRGFGFLLIGFGAYEVLSRSLTGLWWIVLGLFVLHIAGAEEYRARVEGALRGLPVHAVMTPNPDTACAAWTVEEFAQRAGSHSTYPLSGDGNALVTASRLRRVPRRRRATTTVREIACPSSEVPTAGPDDPVTALLSRMRGNRSERALVFDGGHLVGIVSPSDIDRAVSARRKRHRNSMDCPS
jgi:Zn-dependent protease